MIASKQPVFVIGYPRSGTTFLLHFLLSSGEFPKYLFDETHFFSHYYRRYGRLSHSKRYHQFCQDIFASHWFRVSGIDKDQLLKRVGTENIDYAGFFIAFMDLLAEQQGYERWLEKTPWHILYIREIKASIPEAKILLIRRDPRDVALSIYNYGWSKGILKGPVRAAIAWRWHMSKAVKDCANLADDVLSLSYEDLVNNTVSTTERISRFLDIKIDLGRVQTASHGVLRKKNSSYGGDDSPVFRWKSCEDIATLRRIEYALKDSLSLFGYESADQAKPGLIDRVLINAAGVIYGFAKQMRQLFFPLVRK